MAAINAHPSLRETARLRRRRDDLWLAISALTAALLALPLASSSWHGPEVSAVLAIAATALLAGQRWAVAVIVLAELLLVPTVWPRAFLGGDDLSRLAALGSLLMIIPGVLATRRAAASLVLITGWKRTRATCRRFQLAFAILGVFLSLLPMF